MPDLITYSGAFSTVVRKSDILLLITDLNSSWFLFSYPLSTISKEKIEGLWTGYPFFLHCKSYLQQKGAMKLSPLCTQYEGIRILPFNFAGCAEKSDISFRLQLVGSTNNHPIIRRTASPLQHCACNVKLRKALGTEGEDCDWLCPWQGFCIVVVQP